MASTNDTLNVNYNELFMKVRSEVNIDTRSHERLPNKATEIMIQFLLNKQKVSPSFQISSDEKKSLAIMTKLKVQQVHDFMANFRKRSKRMLGKRTRGKDFDDVGGKTNDDIVKQKKPRSGSWTNEEVDFVNFALRLFQCGIKTNYINEGQKLRPYLAGIVNCKHMRVTKKYSKQMQSGDMVFVLKSIWTHEQKMEYDQLYQAFKDMVNEKEGLSRIVTQPSLHVPDMDPSMDDPNMDDPNMDDPNTFLAKFDEAQLTFTNNLKRYDSNFNAFLNYYDQNIMDPLLVPFSFSIPESTTLLDTLLFTPRV
jgi:hypothetical protein